MSNTDLKTWIDKFFDQGVQANKATLEEIKKFTVIWMIFEKYICGENANYSIIESEFNKIKKKDIRTDMYDIPLRYFQNRYINKNGITADFVDIFNKKAADQAHEPRCIKVLKAESTDPLEILKGLMFLMYRYRNNLFHGVKDVLRLDDQYENFVHANLYLSNLMLFLKTELNIQTT